MKTPLVSIIIVTYNSSDYINACLKSIFSNSYSNFEILVFDNNSSDQTISVCKSFLKSGKLRIIKSKKNLGFALANNLAVEKIEGKFIFFLNPDTIAEQDFLEPLVNQMLSDQKIAACQPLVYLFDKKTINLTGKVTHFLGFDWLRDFNLQFGKEVLQKKIYSEQIYSFSGSGVLLRKEIFKKVGGFDSKYFMYYEDSDLSWKINLLGLKICFEPKSVLNHDYKYLPQENIQPLKQKLFYIERNRLITVLKNYSTRTLLLILPSLIFMELGMIGFAFFEGWGLIKLKTYWSVWQLRQHLLNRKAFIQKNRLISDKKILENFVGEITFEKFSNPIVKFFVNPILKIYFKGLLKII